MCTTVPESARAGSQQLSLVPPLAEDDTPTSTLAEIACGSPPRPILRVIKGGGMVGAAIAFALVVAIGVASATRMGVPTVRVDNDNDSDTPVTLFTPVSSYQRRLSPPQQPSHLPRELPIEPPKPNPSSAAVSPIASITALPMGTPAPSPSLTLVPSPSPAPSSAPMASAPAA